MKRYAVFAVLLALFLVWTFPHKILVERMLQKNLGRSDISVRVDDVSPSLWPLGYTLKSIDFSRGDYSMAFDSIRIGAGFGHFSVEAAACGGAITGTDSDDGDNRNVNLSFVDIDPGRCLTLGGLTVKGVFSGTFSLTGLGRGKASGLVGRVARKGRLEVDGSNGLISGHLPAPQPTKGGGKSKEPRPIGEWQFAHLSLEAVAESGNVVVESAKAEAEGVEWVVSSARLAKASAGGATIEAQLKARRIDNSPRSKAILGLMPRASEKDGWRSYKITGPVSAPQILGLR